MENQELNQKLEQLLIKLSKDFLLKNRDEYIKGFENIYKGNFRHEYSTLTRVIMSINDVEERDFLPEKIKTLNENITDNHVKEKVRKLWDHINLENFRISKLESISKSADEALKKASQINERVGNSKNEIYEIDKRIKNDLQNTQSDLKKTEKKLKKLQKTMKDSTTQSITILSIFAGVVMAFTGGMSYISQALASLNQIGPYRAGVFILLIGVIMFDVIFLLLYMIGKLTEKYMGSTGKCSNSDPKEVCRYKSISCCINRYPYMVWFNFITITMLWTILLIELINKYKVMETIFIEITSSMIWDRLALFFILILGFIMSYMPFLIIIYKILNTKCKCTPKSSESDLLL